MIYCIGKGYLYFVFTKNLMTLHKRMAGSGVREKDGPARRRRFSWNLFRRPPEEKIRTFHWRKTNKLLHNNIGPIIFRRELNLLFLRPFQPCHRLSSARVRVFVLMTPGNLSQVASICPQLEINELNLFFDDTFELTFSKDKNIQHVNLY